MSFFINKWYIKDFAISQGEKVNTSDKNRWTPLHFAAQEGHTEIVELLLKKESIDVPTERPSALSNFAKIFVQSSLLKRLLLNYRSDDRKKNALLLKPQNTKNAYFIDFEWISQGNCKKRAGFYH